MRTLRAAILLAALVATVCAAPAPAVATPDTSDPFYAPPANYQAAEPGSILRVREIQASYSQLVPMPVAAWQVLYRTTNADGRPYAAVTTIMKSRRTDQPAALLSYQNMTDAIAPKCQPSQVLRQGQVPWIDPSASGPLQLSTMAGESPMVAAALARGWAVSVPDFGGVDNHYSTPREPGYVVLDGIRAAERFEPVGLPGSDTRALLWGYSGGAIASAWAAETQPRYAPELAIAGSALGGPVGDPAATLRAANGTPVGGALVPVALMGLMQDSPAFTAALNRYLTPAGKQKIDAAKDNCTPQNMISDLGFDANQFLTASWDDVLADPEIRTALEDRTLGKSAPTSPLYVYNAINDEGSTIGAVDALVSTYCAGGTPVTYRREQIEYPYSGHTLEWFLGAPAALAWLEQRIDTSTAPSGCDTQSVPATVLDPTAMNALVSGILTAPLRVMLGY
ncbi:lipase family protein [Nocardia sp. CDC153]|uniref:lipase family protein n=1 Tax=Nocardia sp. CDC153 TaxID=3112167 RepID=UPI002DB66E81|nr:lipase family protein [Nocardia sp. CDC153]MEC3954176.1 lipase family protein [Nocardia sp. CDC153]